MLWWCGSLAQHGRSRFGRRRDRDRDRGQFRSASGFGLSGDPRLARLPTSGRIRTLERQFGPDLGIGFGNGGLLTFPS